MGSGGIREQISLSFRSVVATGVGVETATVAVRDAPAKDVTGAVRPAEQYADFCSPLEQRFELRRASSWARNEWPFSERNREFCRPTIQIK